MQVRDLNMQVRQLMVTLPNGVGANHETGGKSALESPATDWCGIFVARNAEAMSPKIRMYHMLTRF